MDKVYDHKLHEKNIYALWEKGGYFSPKRARSTGSGRVKGSKPFIIILPPPNASGKMHIGNVLMIAIEDILIRWHRMRGDPSLWIPGTDHAGTETQITFERELATEGKSRSDFSREEFFNAILGFVQENKHLVEDQIRRMGASVDWTRYKFTLDEDVVKTVCSTFKKMYNDGLVYRGEHIVNYCVTCGTTYADVEIRHKEKTDPLYFVKYKLVDQKSDEPEFLEVATVRPETIMADTHLAVNPKDKKMTAYIGRKLINPLTGAEMEIISDNFVDPEFGTGLVKLTPAHDKKDYEAALKNNLPIISIINTEGRLTNKSGSYSGMEVAKAREKVVEELEKKNLIAKIQEDYKHKIPVCKAGHEVEQLTKPNWFIKVDDEEKSFKKPALDVVLNGDVKIYPKWREKTYIRWMEEMRDWPISRQAVWGIQIPAWYCKACGEWTITDGEAPNECSCGKTGLVQDPDAFDTWFSSGQWPLVTLGYPDSPDFKYFYPTTVLETGWEIIRLWVSRMIMFGLYLTGKPPFEYVYLHGLVRAIDGRKMSKSLGNVINPEEYIEEFGVDALRMGLISGTANGKDFSFPRDRVLGYRNFTNKIWNMTRFFLMILDSNEGKIGTQSENQLKEEDKVILEQLNTTIKSVNESLEKFRFADAGETIYQFMWHELADKYIEQIKNREDKDVALGVFAQVFSESLKLLHPFMPFITEKLWQTLHQEVKEVDYFQDEALIVAQWPTAK